MRTVRFLEEKESNLTPVFSVGSSLLGFITFLLVVGLFFKVNSIESRGTPTLVELKSGESVRVSALGQDDRSPEAIRHFIGDTLTLMFDWSGIKPPATIQEAKNPIADPGISVGDRVVATGTWQAGFALSEDFRGAFLQKLAELTPQSLFKQGGQSSRGSLVVRHISVPEKTAPGYWKVNLVANLLIFQNSNNLGRALPFNKTIFIRAVDTPEPRQGASATAQTIYQIRRAGLEIYQIQDLALEN